MDFIKAEQFHDACIDYFGAKYPRFFEEDAKIGLVVHAFEDKIPLLKVLLRRGMLAFIVLKKSSSEMQTPVAEEIERMAQEYEIPVYRSETIYGKNLKWLNQVNKKHKIVIGDHGCYFGRHLKQMADYFGPHFLGFTEHTINGKVRHAMGVSWDMPYPYIETAELILKFRSDREIAHSIAEDSLDMVYEATGKNLKKDGTIFIMGYGTMGMHYADKLQRMGCKSEIIIGDIDPLKCDFIEKDGFSLLRDLDQTLERTDLFMGGSNTVVGMRPVLKRSHFGRLKKDACLGSMTSFTDEARQDLRMKDGTIRPIGHEGKSRVYETAAGNRFYLPLDGRPLNAGRANGGVDDAILEVEAAGIGGAFYAAELAGTQKTFFPTEIPKNDCRAIAQLWLAIMRDKPVPPLPLYYRLYEQRIDSLRGSV